MTAPELALVVPCHNEAARLEPDAFLGFLAAHPSSHLIFVDDGSDDQTRVVLDRIQAGAPSSITVLGHAPRRGKAETVRVGILEGLRLGAPLVGFFDADLSTPLAAVDDFLALLRVRPAVELVLGSRVMLMGKDIRRKATRHYLGRVFATAASLTLDLPVYDTQCGAKILRVTAETPSLFTSPFHSPWIFDVELIARYLQLPVPAGAPPRRDGIYELALAAWHDRPGSKLRWHDFARAMVELGYIWRMRRAPDRGPAAGTTTRQPS